MEMTLPSQGREVSHVQVNLVGETPALSRCQKGRRNKLFGPLDHQIFLPDWLVPIQGMVATPKVGGLLARIEHAVLSQM